MLLFVLNSLGKKKSRMEQLAKIIERIAAKVTKTKQIIECPDCQDKGLIFVDRDTGCTVFRCTCKAGMARPETSIPFATFEGEPYEEEGEIF